MHKIDAQALSRALTLRSPAVSSTVSRLLAGQIVIAVSAGYRHDSVEWNAQQSTARGLDGPDLLSERLEVSRSMT